VFDVVFTNVLLEVIIHLQMILVWQNRAFMLVLTHFPMVAATKVIQKL
jgi:hypothetical protein